MKKSRIAWIVLSVVLALAVIAGGVFYYLNQRQRQQEATQAELAQQTAYEQFTALTDDIRKTARSSASTIWPSWACRSRR